MFSPTIGDHVERVEIKVGCNLRLAPKNGANLGHPVWVQCGSPVETLLHIIERQLESLPVSPRLLTLGGVITANRLKELLAEVKAIQLWDQLFHDEHGWATQPGDCVGHVVRQARKIRLTELIAQNRRPKRTASVRRKRKR